MRRNTAVFLAMGAWLAAAGAAWGLPAYQDAVLANSPVGYWRMSEVYPGGSGQIANLGSAGTAAGDQYSNFGNDPATSMIGAPWASLPGLGADNKAARLSSADPADKIEIPHQDVYNPTTAFSLEAWIRFDSGVPNDGVIISKYYGAGNQRGFAFLVDNTTGKLDLMVSRGGTSATTTTYTSQWSVTFEQWTHVAAVYQTGAAPRFYINGQLDPKAQDSAPFQNVYESTAALRIGSWVNGNWYNGLLDEVAFYNTALGEEAIQAHYQAASLPEPAGLALLACGGIGVLIRRRNRSA